MKSNNLEDELKKVREWYLSFVPLAIAVILSIVCFLFEYVLWLYSLCIVAFALFVILFSRAEKRIVCKDGYTLVQAMHFYKNCKKSGIDTRVSALYSKQLLFEKAKQFEFAKELDYAQIQTMYRIGKKLTKQLGNRRR